MHPSCTYLTNFVFTAGILYFDDVICNFVVLINYVVMSSIASNGQSRTYFVTMD